MTGVEIIPHPTTGEALDLRADDDQLARWFDEIRDLERQLAEVRSEVGRELTARCDQRAKWSFQAGDLKVSVPSPAPTVEWSVDALKATLADLLSDGRIGEDAADAALELVVTYKPRVAGLNALCKLGEDVAERIEACGTSVDKPRRVTVKRA